MHADTGALPVITEKGRKEGGTEGRGEEGARRWELREVEKLPSVQVCLYLWWQCCRLWGRS